MVKPDSVAAKSVQVSSTRVGDTAMAAKLPGAAGGSIGSAGVSTASELDQGERPKLLNDATR